MITFEITDHLGKRERLTVENGKVSRGWGSLHAGFVYVEPPPRCPRCAKLRRLAGVPAWLWLLPLAFVLLLAMAGAVRP
jgi:hypothetical protein